MPVPPPCSARRYAASSHGLRSASGSRNHGRCASTARMKSTRPARLPLIGPATDGTASWPISEFFAPRYGTRLYDGRRPYSPHAAEGMRTELRRA